MSRRTLGLISLGALAVVVVGAISQVVLPPLFASRIEDRLTGDGGTAEVTLHSFPAARLLAGDGDRIEVRGDGLDLDLAEDPEVFERLDGFDDVDVALDDLRAGPFEVAGFELTRSGSGPYRVLSTSTTTPRELTAYGASRLGLPGGPLLGYLSGQVPNANRPIPVELDMELRSDDGRVVVTSGGGKIAGVETGPLAQLITEAIVVRL